MNKNTFKVIILNGLLVGTADILLACASQFIKTGNFPFKIFHFIAGGALGLESSMAGGIGVVFLGMLFHYFIAIFFTFLFFFIFSIIWNKFENNIQLIGFGLLYGSFIGCVMRFVILPFTKLPKAEFDFRDALIGWLILSVAIGIPLSFLAKKYLHQQYLSEE